MRFHVVSLPHTQTTSEFSSCAYTQKVVRFCEMMKNLGHGVVLYSGVENEAVCDVHIPCLDLDKQQEIVGDGHYTQASWTHPLWAEFNANAIEAMKNNIGDKDFICLIGGSSHKPIADAFQSHMSVEFGIGYSGTFAKHRVFESYAWMHVIHGMRSPNPMTSFVNFYDDVIPNQVDERMYSDARDPDDYFVFLGRRVDAKGVDVAQTACARAGVRLIVAGPRFSNKPEGGGYGEFVGEVGPEERTKLLSGAKALLCPSLYAEPFGTVAIEAMACGTPVISTDWGAFTETVVHGVHGFRCRMLRDFIAALSDVDKLNRREIQQYALNTFGMRTIAKKYEAYFERLMTLWGDGWYET